MRDLAGELTAGLKARVEGVEGPVGVRELCAALCEAMAERRGGRRVELRFERFPDDFEVTGLWLEFQDFDLVIVEERAEAVQQLVILGHELWHMHAGHCHHHVAGAVAARALAGQPGWREHALAVAARNGSHASDEREAEDFGHRLAADLRTWMAGSGDGERAPADQAPADPVRKALQTYLGYGGHGGHGSHGGHGGPQSGPRR
ncbi:toxin-antitoxin system, toxin component family protein [Streptomyces spongiae]|uniref:Toxin-antitoxin system, toxin component family protein n=2 Tax=Streptomyces spongiae TaxID=565072 RepID=A0A5N8XW03_9ACTN|nr:toxin-antitoxin system, toxin component family protein [Streptomyces spongiae]